MSEAVVRILIVLLSAWISSIAFAQDVQQQAPPAQTQQQPEVRPQSPPASTEPAERAAPAPPAIPPAPPPAGTAAGERICPPCEPRQQAEQTGEYWPPIRGYRLKVTDTLIAAFTALMLLATWLLWRATRQLVRNSEINAERQLRAYLAVVPKTIGGFRPGTVGRIEWVTKNLGQTPAQKIRHRYAWAVLPNPLPARHKFAEPSQELSNTSALLPGDQTVSYFNGEAGFTNQQVEAVSRNEARIYCWGYTEYEDVFRVTWRSRFSVSVGGEAFSRAMGLPADHPSAPPWNWEYGNGHNEIEQAR